MKSLQTPKFIALTLCLLLAYSFSVFAQGTISTRFSNAQFDEESRTYCLDVELQSNLEGQYVYGMNMRFFYDATKLEFLNMTNFAQGYGQSVNATEVTQGDEWGARLFNLDAAADAVNEAVQLLNQESALEISTQSWSKFCEVCFTVPESISGGEDFCPSVIWDLKSETRKGSFLRGSSGVVITTFENNVTKKRSPNRISATHYNWEGYANQSNIPYGVPFEDNCTTLNVTTNVNPLGTDRFELFQNQPNPFGQVTDIKFYLPESSEAKLIFFDMTGKTVKVLEGDYAQGMNSVRMDKKDFSVVTNVMFYRLETPTRTSGFKKMIFVK